MSIDIKVVEAKLRTDNETFYRNSLEFQDMEAQYAHHLKNNPACNWTLSQYVATVYCAENSPHPARFARWYVSHVQEAKQRQNPDTYRNL